MLIEITVLFCYVEKLRYSGKIQMGSGREAQGREDVYTRTADSHCTAETNTTVLSNCTPIQHKK